MNNENKVATPLSDSPGNDPLQILPLGESGRIRKFDIVSGTPQEITLGESTAVVKIVIYPESTGIEVFYGVIGDFDTDKTETFLSSGAGAYVMFGIPDDNVITIGSYGSTDSTIKVIEY